MTEEEEGEAAREGRVGGWGYRKGGRAGWWQLLAVGVEGEYSRGGAPWAVASWVACWLRLCYLSVVVAVAF